MNNLEYSSSDQLTQEELDDIKDFKDAIANKDYTTACFMLNGDEYNVDIIPSIRFI